MKSQLSGLVLVAVLTGLCFQSQAATPGILSYQGRVLISGTPFTGSGDFKFALVDGTSNTILWLHDDNTSPFGTEPATSITLTVTNGLYSVLLGDAPMQSIPPTVFDNVDVRLRIWFNDGPHGKLQLTPDARIAPAAYALTTTRVNGQGIFASDAAASGVSAASGTSKAGVLSIGTSDGPAVQGLQVATGLVALFQNNLPQSTQTVMLCSTLGTGTAATFDQKSIGNPSAKIVSFQKSGTEVSFISASGTLQSSDRNRKTAFENVNTADVLKKLNSIPITKWTYKIEDPSIRHMGPMAQDFYATFGLGGEDKFINGIDTNGVCMAAIQALNTQNQEKDKAIAALRKQEDALKKQVEALNVRLERLESMLNK